MKENTPFEALFEADETTVSRIAAQCPADWDENRIFKRSYQKYKAKRRGAVLPLPHRRYRDPLRAAFTVACLMVTVGGAGSIWYFKYAVQKPEMSVNVETAPTDQQDSTDLMTTEDTTQTASGASLAVPTETVPTETVPIEWEMDMELHTTAPVTASAEKPTTARETAVTAAHTTTASQKTAQTTAQMQTETAARSTSKAAPSVIVTTPVQTETAPAPTFPPTEPPTEQNAATTAPPAADAPDDSDFMEEPTEPSQDYPPSGDAPPSSDSAPSQSGSGFTFRQESEDWNNVTFQSSEQTALDAPEFSLELNGFTLQSNEKPDSKWRDFKVQDTARNRTYLFSHTTYDEFLFSYRVSANEYREITVGGKSGYLFWIPEKNPNAPPDHEVIYTLIWDNGAGVTVLSGVDKDGETLMKIAASITVTF